MTDTVTHSSVLSAIPNFTVREVDFKRPAVANTAATTVAPGSVVLPANLGPLTAFVGNWTGVGFNTIFRPQNTATPTFPAPLNTSDNVLELNLTQESLSFSPSLQTIPNRGSGTQADVKLNGVPYLQSINDVTSLPANGIHFEPGMWLCVPPTAHPTETAVTFARMASIPHGTTIVAQGVVIATVAGGPRLDPVGITPFLGGQQGSLVPPFPSQTATNAATPRLPQNLGPFIAAGTITQAMIDDPNTVLRAQVLHQTITKTVVIGISTNPAAPLLHGPLPAGPLSTLFGGGPSNIAFLQGLANPPSSGSGPNAQTVQMDAIFWIETVEYEVDVPEILSGLPPVVLTPRPTVPPTLQPTFLATLPFVEGKKCTARTIKVSATQIQYTQKVILNFAGLGWPHVSVATLVPAAPVPIPLDLLPLT